MTAALGRWTARAYRIGQDDSGLGRWSYIEFQGANNIKYIILSGYRVGPKPPKLGANTVYNQQYCILLSQGKLKPQPRQQFVTDLLKQVQYWQQHHTEVLLCLDANEDVEALNPIQELGPLLAGTDLVDAHAHAHPHTPRPATYHRGTRPIDIFLASPRFISAITKAYILPFGQPVTMPGDHRTLGIDFDTKILFGNHEPPTLRYAQQQGVNSNAIPTVHHFCKIVTKGWHDIDIQG